MKNNFKTIKEIEKELKEGEIFCRGVNERLAKIEKMKEEKVGADDLRFDYIYDKNKELRIRLKQTKQICEMIEKAWAKEYGSNRDNKEFYAIDEFKEKILSKIRGEDGGRK